MAQEGKAAEALHAQGWKIDDQDRDNEDHLLNQNTTDLVDQDREFQRYTSEIALVFPMLEKIRQTDQQRHQALLEEMNYVALQQHGKSFADLVEEYRNANPVQEEGQESEIQSAAEKVMSSVEQGFDNAGVDYQQEWADYVYSEENVKDFLGKLPGRKHQEDRRLIEKYRKEGQLHQEESNNEEARVRAMRTWLQQNKLDQVNGTDFSAQAFQSQEAQDGFKYAMGTGPGPDLNKKPFGLRMGAALMVVALTCGVGAGPAAQVMADMHINASRKGATDRYSHQLANGEGVSNAMDNQLQALQGASQENMQQAAVPDSDAQESANEDNSEADVAQDMEADQEPVSSDAVEAAEEDHQDAQEEQASANDSENHPSHEEDPGDRLSNLFSEDIGPQQSANDEEGNVQEGEYLPWQEQDSNEDLNWEQGILAMPANDSVPDEIDTATLVSTQAHDAQALPDMTGANDAPSEEQPALPQGEEGALPAPANEDPQVAEQEAPEVLEGELEAGPLTQQAESPREEEGLDHYLEGELAEAPSEEQAQAEVVSQADNALPAAANEAPQVAEQEAPEALEGELEVHSEPEVALPSSNPERHSALPSGPRATEEADEAQQLEEEASSLPALAETSAPEAESTANRSNEVVTSSDRLAAFNEANGLALPGPEEDDDQDHRMR